MSNDVAVRVAVADDSALARKAIRAILERAPGIEVIGEAADGLAALDIVVRLEPDVLILDLEMPELDGRGVLAALERQEWAPAVVVLTAGAPDAVVLLESGASRVVCKPRTGAGGLEGAANDIVAATMAAYRLRRTKP